MLKKKRSVHQTQWAAQFAVASELCKKGYQVAFTHGNNPAVDILVISPRKKAFQVEVKGLYKPNYWQLKKQKPRKGLFYIFAYVPNSGPNRFFVMSQRTVNGLLARHRAKAPSKPDKEFRWGIVWPQAERYEDNWKVLPDYRPSRQFK